MRAGGAATSAIDAPFLLRCEIVIHGGSRATATRPSFHRS
jgi:hypothetical protein